MSEDPYFNLGYALGQMAGFVFIVGGLVWLIVWAVRSSRKTSAQRERVHAELPARLGLAPGEALGALWQAVHPSGAAMVVTITSAGVLALNYTVGVSPAIRIAREGVRVSCGQSFAPPLGSTEPHVQLNISSPHYASFGVIVAAQVASEILTWAGSS